MSPLFADIVGVIGSVMMVFAYAYSNIVERMNFVFFNMLNLVGSLMLIFSLTIHFNLGSMMMEIVWAIIALLGLAKAVRGKGKA